MEHAFPSALKCAGFFVRDPQRNSFDVLGAFRIRGFKQDGIPERKMRLSFDAGFFCKACFTPRLLCAAGFYTPFPNGNHRKKAYCSIVFCNTPISFIEARFSLASRNRLGRHARTRKGFTLQKLHRLAFELCRKRNGACKARLQALADPLGGCVLPRAYSFNRQSPSAAQAQKACLPWRAFHG